jgi:hypothetical protein
MHPQKNGLFQTLKNSLSFLKGLSSHSAWIWEKEKYTIVIHNVDLQYSISNLVQYNVFQ